MAMPKAIHHPCTNSLDCLDLSKRCPYIEVKGVARDCFRGGFNKETNPQQQGHYSTMLNIEAYPRISKQAVCSTQNDVILFRCEGGSAILPELP